MLSAKAFITNGSNVNIYCPSCHRHTMVPLASVKNKHRCKVKCACGCIFVAEVEYREKFRKPVDLPGFYDISLQKKVDVMAGARVRWESVIIDRKIPNCQIIDLSRSGIGFLRTDHRQLSPEDIVRLRFTLDNTAQTQITQECEVRHVRDNFVGCRMLTPNTSLGFYLIG